MLIRRQMMGWRTEVQILRLMGVDADTAGDTTPKKTLRGKECVQTETAAETAAKTTDAGYKTDKHSVKKACEQLKGSTNATKEVKPPTPRTKERLKRALP